MGEKTRDRCISRYKDTFQIVIFLKNEICISTPGVNIIHLLKYPLPKGFRLRQVYELLNSGSTGQILDSAYEKSYSPPSSPHVFQKS